MEFIIIISIQLIWMINIIKIRNRQEIIIIMRMQKNNYKQMKIIYLMRNISNSNSNFNSYHLRKYIICKINNTKS